MRPCYTPPIPYSIIFCGTPEFAVPTLRALATDERFEVLLVCTQPDKPVGRARTITAPPVKIAAQDLGIAVHQEPSINSALPHMIAEGLLPRPDYLVVVAYGVLLSQDVLDIPRIAPINVHGSLLPRWRGASPVEHAILAGDTETGISIQRMVRALDAGPVYAAHPISIDVAETASHLRERLATLSATIMPDLLSNLPDPTPQNENDITICGKLTRDDGDARPHEHTAIHIERMVRALHPWPGVRMQLGDETVKILSASLSPTPDSMPLACAEQTTLFINTLQSPGRTPVSGTEWQRAHHSKNPPHKATGS